MSLDNKAVLVDNVAAGLAEGQDPVHQSASGIDSDVANQDRTPAADRWFGVDDSAVSIYGRKRLDGAVETRPTN